MALHVDRAAAFAMIERAKLPPARVAYRIGEKAVTGSLDTLLSGRSFYTCEGAPISSRSDYLTDQYHLIPVSAEAFVEGRLVDVAVADNLSAKRVIGSDGSQQTLAVEDKQGTICALESDGTCVSGHATRYNDYTKVEVADNEWEDRDLYADPSCSSSLFRAIRPNICGEPTYGIDVRDGRTHVYALIATQKKYLLQRTHASASSCLPLADDGITSYARGPEVTNAFPAARQVRLGEGPLYQHQLASPRTNLLIPLKQGEPFVDEHGRWCTVLSASDGSLRCVPDRWTVNGAQVFSDSKCTKELLASEDDHADLSDLALVEKSPSFPGTVTGLYSLAVYEGPVYGGLDCAEQTPVVRLLMRDKPLPLTVLPEVTVAVR